MSEITVLKQVFYKDIKPHFLKLTNEETFLREISFAIQILNKNSYLQKCEQNSILEAVLNVSQTGLSLNPVLGYAYLVPMKGKCVLMPGYQGLIKLVTDGGGVKSVEVNLIYEGDDCILDLSSDKKVVKHIPYIMTGNEKGEIKGGYSIGLLDDGSRHIEIMSRKDIEDVRACSESYKYAVSKGYNNSPWHTNEPEMFRKTIVRRHFKYLPKSESQQLEKALELDNNDYDFPMTYEQGSYIESLLLNSSIPEKEERQIHSALHSNSMTQNRAKECIEYLKNNQTDPTANLHYSQTDISNSLKNKGLTFIKPKE